MVHVTAIWLPEYLACRVIRRRYGLGREVGHAHLPALGLEHTYPQIHNLHNHPFSSNLYLYFAHIHISLPPPPKVVEYTTYCYYYYQLLLLLPLLLPRPPTTFVFLSTANQIDQSLEGYSLLECVLYT